MPDFWEFPTVSMGLGPICAIYQARFMRYLEDRGLKKRSNSKVWAFLGDGETDEPESLGAITLASREKLDNLIFVINCNLQRLDGPVRGNGQIIQELEAVFRGAGWNVHQGALGQRVGPAAREGRATACSSSAWARWSTASIRNTRSNRAHYVREHFWGAHPQLLEMVSHLSDEQLKKLTLGGHDPVKVLRRPTRRPSSTTGQPTVILARTIKGYGIGEAGEGKNITHQQKKLNEDELQRVPHAFRHPDRRRRKSPRRRSIGRRTTALKSPTCSSGASSSAVSCRAASPCMSSRSRPRRSTSCFSRVRRRAPKGARHPRRWPSCGCWRSCSRTRRSAS